MPPIVNVGAGGTGGWSSSTIVTGARSCLPSFAHRTWASETVNCSGGSIAWSSRIGISTSRGASSPLLNRTRVFVRLKSPPVWAEPPEVDTFTLAAPCDPPVRVTRTSAFPGPPSLVKNAGAPNWIIPAPCCGPAGHRAAGSGRTGGSLSIGWPSGVRPCACNSGGSTPCGSLMKASTADSAPASSLASASKLTCTVKASPAFTDDSGTLNVKGCFSCSFPSDPVSVTVKLSFVHAGTSESDDVPATPNHLWNERPPSSASPPASNKSPLAL